MKQSEALQALHSGANIFLTGEAGSGKTHVLNQFIDEVRAEDRMVAITASTGIAATHIGGTTIHSWSGIGVLDSLDEHQLRKIVGNSAVAERVLDAEILIIDEVSMLDGKRLDMIDIIMKHIKKDRSPFGGLQLILCGDLFQLPPISRSREKDFIFTSRAWAEAGLQVCYLDEQHRHEDEALIDILTSIRKNTIDESHLERLAAQKSTEDDSTSNNTILFTHNVDVDSINNQRLDTIDEEAQVYPMKVRGDRRAVASMIKGCMAPEELVLKKGAEVMFVANNFAGRFVNGTRGRVVDFDGDSPVVKVGSKRITVEEHTWKLMDGGDEIARLTQLPLRLAWAITIHKSQGMSLDSAVIDLSRAFEPGMGYVALSRLRTLNGLRLKGMNNVSLVVDQTVLEFDEVLRRLSQATRESLT